MTIHIPFDNSYARLPDRFFTRLAPTPVRAPALLRVNEALAHALGIDPKALGTPEGVAVLAGNAVPPGAEPLAQAYAGHQFGGWSPQLGDGRAILLGEVVGRDGIRRDIQLKGAGRTPYSRMGDGRAWLGPVLREYLMSEAMHALGIPTTRALAAVTTGEIVLRERPLPGAVLARVAQSHIRVGTFQFFASRQDDDALRTLTDHVIARHYPEADTPLDLLDAVIGRQAALVARWMGVGFIHGVMNTDNTAISGETIDYGPCAFIDTYHPETVYSSIDHYGRYAYNRQPDILVWNLAQFATCLLPLIEGDRAQAIEAATEAVHGFAPRFQTEWTQVFRRKLGLATAEDGDAALAHGLLEAMAAGRADFTLTFRGLADGSAAAAFADPAPYHAWEGGWIARLAREGATPETRATALAAANPAIHPRNHRIEEAIAAAVDGDLDPFERLLATLAHPFETTPDARRLGHPPAPGDEVRQTFCGT
ncbi:protein adenylyltransferase SelO [Palleronia sp. KMU-117]|uniref:protein adenylyltransferase SelO n=1 Tax=Palleronia sp. KMU-117 TaxID=3434108 RepID=UPI003D72EF5A